MIRVTCCTAETPGAVAILQLHGGAARPVLQQLTGRAKWDLRHAYFCRFGDIDEGIAIMLADDFAQVMPHGGLRVVQELIERLTRDLGCVYETAPDTRAVYPEAASPIEADVLDTIARAASPTAIDLLAAQPALWAALMGQGGLSVQECLEVLARSHIVDRLITPATVVVAGPANAGKSTLTNALMGRAVSIVADLPGTTRDWVGGLVELSMPDDANRVIAVNWLDTPGLRESADVVEQRAIAMARRQIQSADVLIAMRGRDQAWPDADAMPRPPDLWVVNKADDATDDQGREAGASEQQPILISARHNRGLGVLQSRVIIMLGLDRIDDTLPWAFNDTLQRYCRGQDDVLAGYLGGL